MIAQAHAVPITAARHAPREMVYLYPGGTVTYDKGFQCPRGAYFSDVSAYTWKGGKLGRQTWESNGPYVYSQWRSGFGGRVTFDGITFRNETPRRVLVAGWCG